MFFFNLQDALLSWDFFEIVNTAANILVANEMKNYEISVKCSTFS